MTTSMTTYDNLRIQTMLRPITYPCAVCGAPPDPRFSIRVNAAHDKMDVRPCNLLALCSRCHLLCDQRGPIANAARTRRAKRIAAGQLEIEL